MMLFNQQQQALEHFQKWAKHPGRRYVLAGYAGTGKTTLIPHLRQPGTVCLAYTNRASRVLQSKGIPAQTIHSFMYQQISENPPRFIKRRRVAADLIIVDESSMVGASVRRDLESYKIPVVYVGDPFQLPPVDDGASVMIKPNFLLEEVHRHAGPIADFANSIRTTKKWPHTVDRYEVDYTAYDMIICHRNKTRQQLNSHFRIGPPQIGDQVCVMKTNHFSGAFNGDIGIILDLDPLVVKFDDMTKVLRRHTFGSKPVARNVTVLDYGYAITCHKAQGSEFDKVLVVDEGGRVDASWMYTAVTRAVSKVDIAG